MNTFDLTLDLDKSAGVTQWVAIRQGDKSGTTIRATIYDHGTALSGNYTARICMRLPDGTHFYEKDATLSGNVATVTIDETQAASVSGLTHNAYFQIIQGSTVVASTQDFTVKVLRDAMSDAEVGENYSTQIEQAVESLENMTSTIPTKVKDEVDAQLEAHPEWTTTVEDNSLTDAKLIQSGGILDRVARLWHRLDNLLTATPAEAASLTVTDAAKTPLAGLALYGRSTQDGTPTPSAPVPIVSVEGNLCTTANVSAAAGLTYAANADGSLDVNGTATGNSTVYFTSSDVTGHTNEILLPAGSYALSGCPAGGSASSWYLRATATSKASGSVVGRYNDVGGGTTFTLAEECYVSVFFHASSGNAFSNARLAPMFAHGSAVYPYVPYGNAGLWARGKNLFGGFSASDSRAGLDKAYDASTNTLTINGTSTANNNDITVVLTSPIVVPTGARLILSLSGTVSAGNKSQFVVFVRNTNGSYSEYHGMDSNNTVPFTEQGGKAIREIMFRSNISTGAININAHVQLEFGTAATAYVPYAESTTPISLQGHALRSLPDGTRDEVTVDQYGHAVLTQRVGHIVLDGTQSLALVNWRASETAVGWAYNSSAVPALIATSASTSNVLADKLSGVAYNTIYDSNGDYISPSSNPNYTIFVKTLNPSLTTAAAVNSWLAENPITVLYPLATPVTIDLGTIDPIALQGPDMTAQAVPTAPFALTYERDLNVTLALLEAAIADAATS